MLTPSDNVLRNRALLAQASATEGQTFQNALNALSGGVTRMVDEPFREGMQENALAQSQAQTRMGNAQAMDAERQIITNAIQGVKAAPPERQAEVYGQIVRQVEAQGLDIPDWAEDFNNFDIVDRVYSLPPAQMTDWQRKMSMLGDGDDMLRAARISLGLEPDANAMLRGQTGDKVPSGYRRTETGMEYIPGGPADPAVRQAQRGAGITVSPDGTIQIGGNAGIGRSAQNKLDAAEIDVRDELARLERIEASSVDNPNVADMNTLYGNLKRMGLEWQDFIDSKSLTEEQAQYLVDVTTARGDILENVNFTIKQITGAAMTKDEAKRIGDTLPNVNDSPRMFQAKLDRALSRTRAAIARYNMWRNQGLDGKPEQLGTLGDIERQMNARLNDLLASVQDGSISEDEANAIFASEYGL